MTGSRWTSLGAIFCLFSVAFGAFAAHGLDRVFVETGAEYQMFHGLALIVVGLILDRRPSRAASIAAWMFAVGIVLFSGSLYILTLTGVTKWGAVTPFGGLAFLLGWFFLSLAAMGKPAEIVSVSHDVTS